MKRQQKKFTRLPGLGYNAAAIGGNASGPHIPKKGKGRKYNRAQEKARENGE